MTTHELHCDPAVFDVIVRMQAARTAAETSRIIADALGQYGLERFVLFVAAPPEQSFDREAILFESGWPKGFLDKYIDQQMHRHDPVLQRARLHSSPFSWSIDEYFTSGDERERNVLLRAAAFGLRQGIMAPVHGPYGFRTCMGATGANIDLWSEASAAVRFIAVYAVESAFRRVSPPTTAMAITAREKEVLTWSAMGKSAWEIDEILQISKRTVDEHIQTTFRKLGAVNRVQAVAIAMRDRLIQL